MSGHPWLPGELPPCSSRSHQQEYFPDVQPELCPSLCPVALSVLFTCVQTKMLQPGSTKGNISTGSEKNSWLKKIKTQNNPWEELLVMRTWKHLEPGPSSHEETALTWPLNLHPRLLLVLTATSWSGALKTPLGPS